MSSTLIRFMGACIRRLGGMRVFPYKDIEIMGVKFHKEISFENGPPHEAKIRGGSEFFR